MLCAVKNDVTKYVVTLDDRFSILFTECPAENMFPCSEAPLDNPVCIHHLKYCDGIVDCPKGSDEPADCGSG